jgi:hypothetical protein
MIFVKIVSVFENKVEERFQSHHYLSDPKTILLYATSGY